MQVICNFHIAADVKAPRSLFEGGVIKVIVVARPIADVTVEAAMQRSVLALVVAQMPFAHAVIYVTQFLQVLRQYLLSERQAAWFGCIQNRMLHSGMNRIFASHQR